MKIKESNFIQYLKKQNEKALLYVIDTYGGLVMSVIRKHLYHMPDKQEECFDDVLLKVWDNISAFDETKNSFKSWIAAIARYRAIDYLRKYQKELHNISWDEVVIYEEDKNQLALIEQEISAELKQMLSCLKPEDQDLFMKLYVEELSVGQVSEEMQISKDAIYNRVSRGKHKIKKQYPRTGKGYKEYEYKSI